jgi:hypothetical protein
MEDSGGKKKGRVLTKTVADSGARPTTGSDKLC